jgi:2-polyprenyl-3-methyl-5-hydroxy-6-metoxy-1,4-benzoquinol methylase
MKLFLERQSDNLRTLNRNKKSTSTVLEIGCGDGYFLSQFADYSRIVGFEPSPEGKLAQERGVSLIDSYFSLDSVKEFDNFDIVILRQVLEHVVNPKAFIKEVKQKISKDGLLYLEVPNGSKSIAKSRFHDFYYEHVSYFTKSSMILLLEHAGFEVVSCISEYDEEIIAVVARYLGDEVVDEVQGLTSKIKSVHAQVQKWIKENKKIVGWGTAGNGSLFFSLLDINDRQIEFVVDSDKRKQGMFLPITNQKVISPNDLFNISPDVVIVLSQFHSNEITKQARDLIGDKIIINFFN